MAISQMLNITLELVCCIVEISLLIGVLITKMQKTKLTKIFISMLAIDIFALILDIFLWSFFHLKSEYSWLASFIWFADFFVHLGYAVIAFLFTYYIYTFISLYSHKVSKIPIFIAGAYSIALSLSALTGAFYVITEDGQYIAGPAHILIDVLSVLVLISNFVLVLRHKKSLSNQDIAVFLVFIIMPVIDPLMQLFTHSIVINVEAILTSATMVLMYASIQVQQEMLLLQRNKEQEIAIMLSQIQPHFLYNTLTTISNYYYGTPNAQKAVRAFAHYLRGNMDSLSETKPIPFEQELEHVKHYLLLEKMRFGDRLNIIYDIQTTNFSIPVLTLQPIVENAVHHGITQKKTGGTLTIHTEEKPHCFYITVEDDGKGFDANAPLDSGRMHVGNENVRKRLDAMCGGTLAIKSSPDNGTTVTIEIPKKTSANKYNLRK